MKPTNLIELGKIVKVRWPGKYDQLSDLTVGKRYSRKYLRDALADKPTFFLQETAEHIQNQTGTIIAKATQPTNVTHAVLTSLDQLSNLPKHLEQQEDAHDLEHEVKTNVLEAAKAKSVDTSTLMQFALLDKTAEITVSNA